MTRAIDPADDRLYATHARIDLSAVADNLRAVRHRVGNREVLLAVKADAYGHGAVPVSRHVQETGTADQLGVATVPEALELRGAGITLPILKLSHVLSGAEAEAAVGADVALTVVDEASARLTSTAARTLGRVAQVHLKVDTGMRRIGAQPEAVVALARHIQSLPAIDLVGLMTHLPVSDTPDGVAYTENQLALFHRLADEVQAVSGPLPYIHAANSGGICGHPASWGTLVRPGIMAYGSFPDHQTPRTVRLRPAYSLATRVSAVKRVRAGETVGYGRTWTAAHDTTIATIPIGYADGYSRLLSNRGNALVGGHRHSIAGRVCMDQTMLDLGPDSTVTTGDEVILIGHQGDQEISVWDVADLMGTIPYEVTCLISDRVPREY